MNNYLVDLCFNVFNKSYYTQYLSLVRRIIKFDLYLYVHVYVSPTFNFCSLIKFLVPLQQII
jgi:hypothetical protein